MTKSRAKLPRNQGNATVAGGHSHPATDFICLAATMASLAESQQVTMAVSSKLKGQTQLHNSRRGCIVNGREQAGSIVQVEIWRTPAGVIEHIEGL
jgi:hypothetical protein